MLVSGQLTADEAGFEEVCEYVGTVNRTRRDDPEINWTREDWDAVHKALLFRMSAVDMQRTAEKGEAVTMVDIETVTKPGDLIGYLNAVAGAAIEPIVVKAILEKAAKHAEAMLQAKTWSESVVDSVQDKVKELRGRIDLPPIQKELTQ